MDININSKGKHLFLILSTISLILIMGLTTLLWWFVSPRLHEIHKYLAFFILLGIRIFFLLVITGILLILLTCYLERNFLITKFVVRLSIKFLFPVTVFLGKIFGISKEKMRESFIHVNNAFIKAIKKKFSAGKILLLLPHCLQNLECPHRITNKLDNCRDCGKCNIGELLRIATDYRIHIAIATGGTLARRIIIKLRPNFIIAVACQRDLVDGIQDVFPVPVYGVLNERPEGPCINTFCDTNLIRDTLNKLIMEG